MAIDSLTIIQDNTIGDVNLLASHSPLVFIVQATFTGIAPDNIYAKVDGVVYKCTYYSDDTATTRSFILIADEIFRAQLPELTDPIQSANTIISVPYMIANVEVLFMSESTPGINDELLNVVGCHASRDFESQYGCTMVNEYNNESKYYIGVADQLSYVYWWNDNAANNVLSNLEGSELTITYNSNPTNGQRLFVGLRRQYIVSNANCSSPGMDTTIYFGPGLDVEIGVTISDTIDNTIAYMESNLSFSWVCMSFEKSGNDLIITDNSYFYNEIITSLSTAPVTYNLVNKVGIYAAFRIVFVFNPNPGDTVDFSYTNKDNITVNTAMVAETSPMFSYEFQIGVDANETGENYLAALLLNYPSLNNLSTDTAGGNRIELQSLSFDEVFFDESTSNPGDIFFTLTLEDAPIGGSTYDKGFIRKAIEPSEPGIITERIFINNTEYTHVVNVLENCTGSRIIKYIDSNGQYRIFAFNQFYSRKSNPKALGEINELVISLLNDSGDKEQIGYKNKDTLILQANTLNAQMLELMRDLYNSPQVYLLHATKWIRVGIKGDNASKQAKRKFKDVLITVLLPQSYNITKL